MRVNIIANDNGVGLSKDVEILSALITEQGYECYHIASMDGRMNHRRMFPEMLQADVNIYLEHYFAVDYCRHMATYNIFIPNPEWFFDKKYATKFDIILAKTKHCERVFKSMGGNVLFTSFTSVDKQKEVGKVKQFIHVAGKSSMKNTDVIYRTWASDSSLPHLFMLWQNSRYFSKENLSYIQNRIDTDTFDAMINKCLIHICTSQYEGFGHYIWEAMSCGNVVLTSKHYPMNEIITDKQFQVNGRITKIQGYGQLFTIDEKHLIDRIGFINSLSIDELSEIGKKNRAFWEKNDAFFKDIFTRFLKHIE